jgi:hypothetical protein
LSSTARGRSRARLRLLSLASFPQVAHVAASAGRFAPAEWFGLRDVS